MNKFYLKIVAIRKNDLKQSFRLTFRREKQLDNRLTMLEKHKRRIKLNKPIHIGLSILELSKILVCYIHYDYIKNKYDDKVELLITETDNLDCEIETENVYKDFYKGKKYLNSANILKIQSSMIR